MDNNNIAILKDYQSSIESSFKKIERLFDELSELDPSQKNYSMNNINSEMKSVKYNIDLIKYELVNLKEESNINKWNEILSQINARNDKYKMKYNQIENEKNNNNEIDNDYLNIDAKVDLSKMTSQQVIDRGTKILQSDKNAIDRMKKIVYQDLETMKEVNKELVNQHEKLENTEIDFNEIDNSMNRAGKQIKNMAKMYSTDKIIICMIFCILLVVIAIIIISVFFDSESENENTKQDIFNN